MSQQHKNDIVEARRSSGGAELPPGAILFVRRGIPQMFLGPGGYGEDERACLHVPYSQLPQDDEGEDAHFGPSLECDDYRLYPVLSGGEAIAMVGVPAESGETPGAELASTIATEVCLEMPPSPPQGSDASLFSRLLQAGKSLGSLAKTALANMIEGSPEAIAALYFETERAYKLQFAVGQIGMSDRLTSSPSMPTQREWRQAVDAGQEFVPAELLPDGPAMLDEVPDFVFVREAIKASRGRYVVVMAVPGDIGRAEMERPRGVAELMAGLQESQFDPSAETAFAYRGLGAIATSSMTRQEALVEVFRRLEPLVDLSRIAMVWPDRTATVVVRDPVNGLPIRDVEKPPVPETLLDEAFEGAAKIVEDVEREPALAEKVEEYEADRVGAEILCPVRLDRKQRGVVAFGFLAAGRRVTRHRELLESVAQFMSLPGFFTAAEGDFSAAAAAPSLDSHRLDTIHKLAGGYYHDIMSKLSVVIGQAELIESSHEANGDDPASRVVLTGATQIAAAADQIADDVGYVRDLCTPDRTELDRVISSRDLGRELPNILRGYARQIRDTRNLNVSIEFKDEDRDDFPMVQSDLYDFVLPALLTLMDSAVRSGSVSARVEDRAGGGALVFEAPLSIVGAVSPEETVRRAYPQAPRREDGAFELESYSAMVEETSDQRMRFTLVQTTGEDIESVPSDDEGSEE